MNVRAWLLLVLMCTLTPLGAAAQEEQDEKLTREKLVQQWDRYAEPGEQHRHLEALAGTWKVDIKVWTVPDEPPEELEGTAENRMILGGRFLQQDFRSGEGDAFAAHGVLGYDNFKQKYVWTWVDTKGTLILVSEGTGDGSGSEIVFESRYDDPVAGSQQTMRQVIVVPDQNRHVVETYIKASSHSKEVKILEMTYRRAGS